VKEKEDFEVSTSSTLNPAEKEGKEESRFSFPSSPFFFSFAPMN
jgi:hypothetical protein